MRHRSKSLVQTIASDVPSPYDPIENTPKPVKLQKSKSIPNLNQSIRIDRLHPFSSKDLNVIDTHHFTTNYSTEVLELNDYISISQQSNVGIHNFLTILDINSNQLMEYRSQLFDIQEDLNHIETNYFRIHDQTQEFNEKSLELMKQESEMSAKFQSINTILQNFETLNEITKKLSVPNNSKVIKSKSFGKILNDLNSSLNFINDEEFKDFKNIDTYKIKFRQCMTRCLTLIKSYLVNELNKLETSIKISTKNDQELNNIAIYSDFEKYINDYQGVDYNFPKLIDIFFIRILQFDEVEYKGLLLEIFKTYFSLRLGLINLDEELNQFKSDDLVKYTQDNLAYLKRLLPREITIFKDFFGLTQIPDFLNSELYNYVKELIDSFYDNFRFRVVREQNISVLCQLTTLLQSYYEYEESDEEVNLQHILDPILFEVQSRLVFRIQLYIDNKLIPYKPTPEDLHIGQSKTQKASVLDEEFHDNLFTNLYLPLGKALTILSQIYELINSVVFDDLAHYIVHSCIQILQNTTVICESHLGKVESKLYYLKNLIILKYQLSNFDIQSIRNDISFDFTSGLNELYNIFRKGEVLITMNSTGVFNMIRKAVPKVINNMIDAKLEIELELNNIINELLAEYLNILIADLQPPGDFNKFKMGISTNLVKFKHQIITYINDSNILKILFENLSQILINYYTEYYEGLGSESIVEFTEPEVFTRFLSGVIEEALDDESLQNNLMNIKPLLKFEEELDPERSEGEVPKLGEGEEVPKLGEGEEVPKLGEPELEPEQAQSE